MNTIHVIAPYLWHGAWVFDDPDAGLKREAFVAGADTLLDRACSAFSRGVNRRRCVVTFSAQPFPGSQFVLRWSRMSRHERGRWKGRTDGGNWYSCAAFKMDAWLCGALLRYFPKAPRQIFVQVAPLRARQRT